jgi:hypothetical protein
MEVFKQIKEKFFNKGTISNHITLFSIIGILFLLFCKVVANTGYGYLLSDYYLAPSSTMIEKYLCLTTFIVGFIYLVGYWVKSLHTTQTEGKVFSDFDLQPFVIFLKSLPLILTWIAYYILFAIFGIIIFSKSFFYSILALLLSLLPFVYIIFIGFAKNLTLRKSHFNPLKIVRLLYRHLGAVIYFSIKFFVVAIITFYLISKLHILFANLQNQTQNLGWHLIFGCVIAYLLYVFHCYYTFRLAKITKNSD